jgi:hypothetical protein
MTYIRILLLICFLPLTACADTAAPEPAPMPQADIQKPVEVYAPPVAETASNNALDGGVTADSPGHTDCFPNGNSRTTFSANGHEIVVTIIRADFITALGHVEVHNGTGDYLHGEVEILSPDLTHVFNVFRNNQPVPVEERSNYDFMAPPADVALNHRYTTCPAMYPTVFWAPAQYLPPRRLSADWGYDPIDHGTNR